MKHLRPGWSLYLYEEGGAYTQLGRWAQAISAMKSFLAHYPFVSFPGQTLGPHIDLVVDYIRLGQNDAARAEVAKIRRLNPGFSTNLAVETEFPAQRERAADLIKAGLS